MSFIEILEILGASPGAFRFFAVIAFESMFTAESHRSLRELREKLISGGD